METDIYRFRGVYTLRTLDSPCLLPADEVVDRARSRIGENNYDLMLNNFEHFARWCRSGE